MAENILAAPAAPALQRRTFLRVSGATAAAAALVLAGCSKDDTTTPTATNVITLPSGDAGLFNYLYLLEQLEAALYTAILAALPADLTPAERGYFADLHDHEVVHRETLKSLLGTSAIPALAFDFSTLTLNTRAGVLAAAQQFEDLGVAAYTGVLPLVSNAVLQALTLKITSVEARHASLLRDLLTPGSFAGSAVVSNMGQNLSKTPTEVIAATAAYIQTYTISVAYLPTV